MQGNKRFLPSNFFYFIHVNIFFFLFKKAIRRSCDKTDTIGDVFIDDLRAMDDVLIGFSIFGVLNTPSNRIQFVVWYN